MYAFQWQRVFSPIQRLRERVTHGRKTLHDPRFHLLSLLIPHNTVSLRRYFRLPRNIIKFPRVQLYRQFIGFESISQPRAALCESFAKMLRIFSRTCLIPITASICSRLRDKSANRRDIATTVMIIVFLSRFYESRSENMSLLQKQMQTLSQCNNIRTYLPHNQIKYCVMHH